MPRLVSTKCPALGRPASLLAAGLVAALSLSGCNALTRLSEVGEAPAFSSIENPANLTGNMPVVMPMPAPVQVSHHPNSLWRPGSRAFLKDQRAADVGDIITVNIEITDNAQINNTTNRTRNMSEDASLNNLLGYEQALDRLFPQDIDNIDLIDADSSSLSNGQGSVNRGEDINLRIAAVVTQLLPNGNMVIAGRQEVRVNFEMRQLEVAGMIRPEDIDSANTVDFDQIAEARISYGGRGTVSDVQQPRYGQQIYDVIWPF
jgi:flagellar L-ring protein precursor FlgH